MLGALLTVPLNDGGRNKANVSRSDAALSSTVYSYEDGISHMWTLLLPACARGAYIFAQAGFT